MFKHIDVMGRLTSEKYQFLNGKDKNKDSWVEIIEQWKFLVIVLARNSRSTD